MKFKGVISHQGMRALERQFLPCLEKFGKQCYLLLTPNDVYLLQDAQDANGMHTSARLENNIIFEPGTCVIQSRNDNHIAFSISIALLLKALRAADAHDADTLQVKLTTRAAPGAEPTQDRRRPMIVLNWQGDNIGLGQELPVGQPCSEEILRDVRRLCDVTTLCPFYLDIFPELQRIMLCVDKLKPLAAAVQLCLTKQGDLHLTVDTTGVVLGQGFPGLEALWQRADGEEDPVLLTSVRMEDRLREARALRDGSLSTALLEVEHLVKALHSAPPTMPQRVLCGVRSVDENLDGDSGGGGGSYVHFMFVYEQGTDENGKFPMHLFYKLPIKEDM